MCSVGGEERSYWSLKARMQRKVQSLILAGFVVNLLGNLLMLEIDLTNP